MMRITIELDEGQLRSVLKATGKTKMSPAVSAALDEYLAMKRREAFVTMVMDGKTDYQASNEELEALTDSDQP
jgi:Arc/MetJ family transcription regulator